MQGRDFIIISINPWYAPLSSTSKNVAMELSKNNRVLYVNAPLDRNTLLFQKKDPILREHLNVLRTGENDLVEVCENVWNFYPACILESINWLPKAGGVHTFLNHINNRNFARSIATAIQKLNFKDYILINDKDIIRGFFLKELLKPDLYIYYDRDYTVGFDYWKKHGARLEPELVAKADIVLTNSNEYLERIKPHNKWSFNVGSGVNLDLFNPHEECPVPHDLKDIKNPVLGFVGALTALRLNIGLIQKLSDQLTQWDIVLVGPEKDEFINSNLHQAGNVHFLGKKTLNELPAYIQHFDVCMNPQLVNEITIGNYPLKIDEYLALGKPVVAVRTKAMKVFEDYVYLADSEYQFIEMTKKALLEDNEILRKERMKLAKAHSWENILNKIFNVINDYTREKQPSESYLA